MFQFAPPAPEAPPIVFLLLLALALDALLGGMRGPFRWLPHPVVIIGKLIAICDRAWNRPGLPFATARLRGIGLVLLVVILCGLVGWGIAFAVRLAPWGWGAEVLLTAMLLAQRSLYDHVRAVRLGLDHGGLEGGRHAVSHIVGRDPNSLDEHGVARAAVESLAENFSDGVLAPALFYLLFGLPGILVYKGVNTLDSMVGYRNATYIAFGWASARLDDVLNLIPARLSGLLFCLSAIIAAKANPWRALCTMLRDAKNHRSPNSGWPEAAMAGALNLALGGPRRYPGLVVEEPWMGQGRARLTAADIRLALNLFVIACLLHAGALAAAVVWLP